MKIIPDPSRRNPTADPEYLASVIEACKVIGVELHSTDRFCREAIEWLTRDGVAEVTLGGNDKVGWSVTGKTYVAGGYTLAEALAGAILAVEEEAP